MTRPSVATAPPYRFWQVLVLLILFFTMVKMILPMKGIHREAQAVARDMDPIFQIARDAQADISKATMCVTHDRKFQIHRVGGASAAYYGAPGVLVRQTDTGSTSYALGSGSVQLGMDHGMIITKVFWRGRTYFFGAPPGWAVTVDELLAQ